MDETNQEAVEVSEKAMFGFEIAIAILKDGGRVARKNWNGQKMFIFLVNGSTFKVNREPLISIYPEGTEINYQSHIDMKTVDGSIVPWVASQTDLLANDYVIVQGRDV